MAVIKNSKPTFDVLTTSNENLTFSSELATHSIFVTATLVKTSPATSVTYTHNLGFIPKAWVYEILNDGVEDYYRRVPITVSSARIDFYITTTTLVVETDSTATKSFRVIIFTRSPNP